MFTASEAGFGKDSLMTKTREDSLFKKADFGSQSAFSHETREITFEFLRKTLPIENSSY